MASDQVCPVPGCGEPIVIKVDAAGSICPRHSAIVDGPCIGFVVCACADHEFELLTGLGDAVDWATVTRLGPPRSVTVGKQVGS
jgi:hypothetical protein